TAQLRAVLGVDPIRFGLGHPPAIPGVGVACELTRTVVEIVHPGVLGDLSPGGLRPDGASQMRGPVQMGGELADGSEVALEHLRGLPLARTHRHPWTPPRWRRR